MKGERDVKRRSERTRRLARARWIRVVTFLVMAVAWGVDLTNPDWASAADGWLGPVATLVGVLLQRLYPIPSRQLRALKRLNERRELRALEMELGCNEKPRT